MRGLVSGVGDYSIEEVEALVDPCSFSSTLDSRTLGDSDQKIYAPMNDLEGFVLDKDAVYVDIRATALLTRKGILGDRMIRDLQRMDADMDEKLRQTEEKLFKDNKKSSGIQNPPRIVVKKGQGLKKRDNWNQTGVQTILRRSTQIQAGLLLSEMY